MALINCPECGAEVSDKASNCPRCAYPFKPKMVKKQFVCIKCGTNKNPKEICPSCGYDPKTGNSKKPLVVILVLISIVIAISYLSSSYLSSSNKESKSEINTRTYTKLDAYAFASEYVKKRLRAPNTAEFPSASEKIEHTQSAGNNTFLINSWVRSQNGFGGMVRNSFKCKVKFNNETVSVTEFVLQ